MFGLGAILGNKKLLSGFAGKMEVDGAIVIIADKQKNEIKILNGKWQPSAKPQTIEVTLGEELKMDSLLNVDEQILKEENQNQIGDGSAS